MRKFSHFSSFILVAIFCTFLSSAGLTQTKADNLRAAFVNIDRVLQNDSSYQTAMQDFKQYRQNLQKRIKQQRQELQKMRQNLKEEGALLSKQQRQKKKQQMARKMQSLRQRAQQSKQQLQQKRQELISPVLKKIDPIVRSVAEENGYNVIYSYGQRNNPSVLWVSEKINITDQIIDRLESDS